MLRLPFDVLHETDFASTGLVSFPVSEYSPHLTVIELPVHVWVCGSPEVPLHTMVTEMVARRCDHFTFGSFVAIVARSRARARARGRHTHFKLGTFVSENPIAKSPENRTSRVSSTFEPRLAPSQGLLEEDCFG
jgi:hypothetical protein